MNVSMLRMVNRTVEEREELLKLIEALTARKLNVTIDGNRQDETITELVLPVILGELRARVRRADLDLEGMGVEVDPVQGARQVEQPSRPCPKIEDPGS